MFNNFITAVLLGAVAISAAPSPNIPHHDGKGDKHDKPHHDLDNWKHHPKGVTTVSSAGQIPFKFPLANGFPDVSDSTLLKIEQTAHSTLPNGALPTELHGSSITTLELIAYNELFEVAFFTSLINNITENVSGFHIDSPALKTFVLNALVTVQAQEELHALGANAILSSAGQTKVQPCEYVFPSADFDSAIRFASTFTNVVLGTLQDAQVAFCENGDSELVPLIGSIIGQEGEQNGYYRSLLDLIPSSNPFLTRSVGPFAYSTLNQNVIVSGTNANNIDLAVFGVLTVETEKIELKDQTLTFSVESNVTDTSSWSVVYINAQNVPVVESLTNVMSKDGIITFDAEFQAATLIAGGLTIAAVTKEAGPFDSVTEVADCTLFGPGLIEIN